MITSKIVPIFHFLARSSGEWEKPGASCSGIFSARGKCACAKHDGEKTWRMKKRMTRSWRRFVLTQLKTNFHYLKREQF